MISRKWIIAVAMVLCSIGMRAQNNPYVDDKLVHFGFSLGVNMMSYHVQNSDSAFNGDIYHARVSNLLPGFSVGFITDLRLARHLNLRFTPQMLFSSRTLKFVKDSDPSYSSSVDMLSIPVTLPLYLKWSAEREGNFRPYVIVGGGATCNVYIDRECPITQQRWDAFVEGGFGCDLYFPWFKLSPEIKYHAGFLNQRMDVPPQNPLDAFYSHSIRRLTNQMISICFNFE